MINLNDGDIYEVEQKLGFTFDETRKNIIKTFDDVQACPGSGKTTMVAAKLLIIAKKWQSKHQGVCVLTHTNVAKQEIIDRLNQDSDGVKLLSYPHFIGTIQEFINKYIAIPALRSNELCVNHIDDEMCNTKAWYLLSHSTRAYLERNRITSLQDLQYKFNAGELELSVPGFDSASPSRSYRELLEAKDILIKDGYYYYHEMYAFANKSIHDTPELLDSIRHRFPFAFIDEMQDTQKFQDELLNKIFLHENVKFQRFGDPDQAIYSGNGEENQTYNTAVLDTVENSHRFDNSIALLAKNLSYNRINLTSNKTVPVISQHTIFLVDENSRYNVFNAFARLCEQAIPIDCVNPIKTVGAVGKRKEESLTICHYLDSFDKDNNINKFKPKKLIHYFYEAKRLIGGHEAYHMVLSGIARCGRMADCELTFSDNSKSFYSTTSIRKYLKDSNNFIDFNMLVKGLIDSSMDVTRWNDTIARLLVLTGMQTSTVKRDFILFESSIEAGAPQNETYSNRVIVNINGKIVENELSTIHSVKGETHAATLVLETKNYNFDIGTLIDYILNENTVKPTAVRKKGFMKMLYVAFSRPEHLLCIAMDKSRFPPEHISKSNYAGWNICDLTT
ncbi:MAG: UvrD-helicase domain-containing protein [Colwellia sp.]|nr:UvrD-helicase domain-containing protein [Colwellia sp.]